MIDVQADVSESGHLMMLTTTSKPVVPLGYEKLTNIYVLNGCKCKIEVEFEMKDVNVVQSRVFE